MEQLETWKNRSKLSDSFDFNFNLKLIQAHVWRDLYEKQGLSAAQIAAKFNAPKSSILELLRQHGVQLRSSHGHSTRTDNYRAPNPPFGYKVLAGKLKTDPREIKICRLIVSLVRDKKLSWSAATDELNRRRVPTRKQGRANWHRHTVKIVYERWNKEF